jgi:hypothetical protein
MIKLRDNDPKSILKHLYENSTDGVLKGKFGKIITDDYPNGLEVCDVETPTCEICNSNNTHVIGTWDFVNDSFYEMHGVCSDCFHIGIGTNWSPEKAAKLFTKNGRNEYRRECAKYHQDRIEHHKKSINETMGKVEE